MKRISLTIIGIMLGILAACNGQHSRESACRGALAAFHETDLAQGSSASQDFMDSLIVVCPTLANAWREKSVPYLKRGDYATWNKLMGKAVELQPDAFLHIRGWCRIKFLHDYAGGLRDLMRYDSLVPGKYKVVDDTHIKIWMALAKQGLNDNAAALRLFNEAIEHAIQTHGEGWVGTYDFLYRGLLKLKMNDLDGAIRDFNAQIGIYTKLSNAYYYRAVAAQRKGQPGAACEDLANAAEYFRKGYYITDPYVVMPGQIEWQDIEISKKRCP